MSADIKSLVEQDFKIDVIIFAKRHKRLSLLSTHSYEDFMPYFAIFSHGELIARYSDINHAIGHYNSFGE